MRSGNQIRQKATRKGDGDIETAVVSLFNDTLDSRFAQKLELLLYLGFQASVREWIGVVPEYQLILLQ